MSGAFEILRTKVRPPSTGVALIARARLISVIHQALQRKFLLLSAEAGYGKTSLLLSALPELRLPVAWLTLDESDADPNLLAAGLVAAVREIVPEFGEEVLQVLTTGPNLVTLRQSLLRGFEAAPPLAVVLDDFHVVDHSPEAAELLDGLLLSLPLTAHLIIASRTWPRLQTLPRLLVAEEAVALDKARLAFTIEEAAAFLRHCHGLSVGEAQVRHLADRTEGWPAALQLVALASKARGTVTVEGTPREIFDYLATTVVGTLTSQIQEFLLRTSILGELWASLCQAVLDEGDPAAILLDLDHRNLFLYRLDEAGARYQYHQLFAEFLQQQLALRGSTAVTDLHRRAGRQLEAEGIAEQAVRHYIAAQAYEDAERVMKPLHGDRLTAKLAYVFRDIVTRLPVSLQEQYPWMTRCGASASRFVGDYQRGLIFAQRAMKAAEGKDLNLWAFAVHGTGVMYSCMDRYEEAIAICRPALSRLDDSVEPRMRGGILVVMADCYVQLGDLRSAEDIIPHLQTLLATQSTHPGKGYAPSLFSGLIAATKLEYSRAAEQFQLSLHHAIERGSLTLQVSVLTELTRTQLALRDVPTAVETLRQTEELHKQTGERATDLHLTFLLGDARLLQGDPDGAADAYQQALDKCRDGESQEPRLWALLGLARVARGRGNLREAESLLGAAVHLCQRIRLGKILPLLRLEEISLLITADRPDAAMSLLPTLRDVFTRWHSPAGLARCAFLEARLHSDLADTQELPAAARPLVVEGLRHAASCIADVRPFLQAEAGWSAALLIEALHQDIEPQIVEPLLMSLNRSAVGPLIATLSRQPLRHRSIAVLGRIGDPEARRPLTRLLANRDPETRMAARRALTMLREPEPARLLFRMLGRFEVFRDSERIEDRAWRTQKVRTLCKYLLLHRDRALHQDQLIDLLWPDANARAGSVNLKTAVKHLRQALEPLLEGTRSHYVRREGEMVRLVVPEAGWIDIDEYDRLLADARRHEAGGDITPSIVSLDQAVELYRGDLLEEDLYADWAALERERRREVHIGVLELLAQLYERRNDHRRAIDTLQRLLALDRLRETAYQGLIRCHLIRGDRGGALRVYQLCERLLREELGVTPQPQTTVLLESAAVLR